MQLSCPAAAGKAASMLYQSSLFGVSQRLAGKVRAGRRSIQHQGLVVEAKRGLSELLTLRNNKSNPDKAAIKPAKVSPRLAVPDHITKPPYVEQRQSPPWSEEPQVHDAEGIVKMRAAGKLAAQVLEMAGQMVKPGVTTDEIDRAVHEMVIASNAYPSPLGYGTFPKSVCTSLNEVICHGIPDARSLQQGDIVNIDVTVYLDGHHGDTSRMFYCGEVSPDAQRLCEATKQGLDAAIRACGPGVPFKAIGRAIHDVADKSKFGVVRNFVGHGVGRVFHAAPAVLHFRNNEPGIMVPGQTFTIEPMFTQGAVRERYWSDGWTAVTADGGWAAQWEHTLLITDSGVEVLTGWEQGQHLV